jgi:long-subunit acyl-CoA synthetase (AMP-forming)
MNAVTVLHGHVTVANLVSFAQCGLYTTSTSDSVSTLCAHAAFRILAVENAHTLDHILAGRTVAEALPTVRKVVLMEGGRGAGQQHADVITWQELMAVGRAETDAGLDAGLRTQAVNEACMLVYTSGTTGKPKGRSSFLSMD